MQIFHSKKSLHVVFQFLNFVQRLLAQNVLMQHIQTEAAYVNIIIDI